MIAPTTKRDGKHISYRCHRFDQGLPLIVRSTPDLPPSRRQGVALSLGGEESHEGSHRAHQRLAVVHAYQHASRPAIPLGAASAWATSMSAHRGKGVVFFRFGDWLVKPDEKAIERNGERVLLEPKIMDVLLCLAEHGGEVISADQLLVECWRGTFYGDNPVHKAIAVLRKALGDQPLQSHYIATIRKRGYQVRVPVVFPDAYAGEAAGDRNAWTEGSPYRGLEAFDERHAEVYFGRSRAIAEIMAALRERRAAGCAFLLLVGASGCGKTSLIRAGLLADADARTRLRWRGDRRGRAYRCQAGGADITDKLAHALGQWEFAGMPLFPEARDPARRHALVRQPRQLVERIESMLARPGSTASQRGLVPTLALVVDQLEACSAIRSRPNAR